MVQAEARNVAAPGQMALPRLDAAERRTVQVARCAACHGLSGIVGHPIKSGLAFDCI